MGAESTGRFGASSDLASPEGAHGDPEKRMEFSEQTHFHIMGLDTESGTSDARPAANWSPSAYQVYCGDSQPYQPTHSPITGSKHG